MAAAVAGLALLLLVVATAGDVYAPVGNADPGPLTTYGFAIVRFVADAAGAGACGALVFSAFVAPGRRDGSLSPGSYAAARLGAGCALAWLAAAVAAVPFSAAVASGQPLAEVLRPAVLVGTIDAAEEPKAWLCVVAAAGVATVLSWQAMAWRTTVAAAVVAVAGLLPPITAGHASTGAGHDLASNALFWHVPAASAWLGALVALLAHLGRTPDPSALVLSRYRRLSAGCFAVTGVSGAVAAFAAAGPDGRTGRYGLLLLAELVLFAGTGVVLARRRPSRSPIRTAVAELILLGLATGGSAALSVLVPPALVDHPATVQETILGYDLDLPPGFARLVLDWRPDLLFGPVALLAGLGYRLGVRRLRRRGDPWSTGRTAAWLAGWAVVLVATSSGLGVYAPGTFSLHMITHMALNMFAPVLLALGGPVTLALRALPAGAHGDVPGAREWVTSLLHAPVTRFFAHPAVAAVLFAGSFYALYFSGLFGDAMRYHWSHQLMKAHFLITGYLFAWVAVGADRTPRPVPHLARLGVLFAVMPFHAFFGVILMSRPTVIAPTYYHYLALTWVGDLLTDQRLGGGIAWAGGEVPMVVMVVALLAQWARDDERRARRGDRHGESDFDAYNAMLAELATRRRTPPSTVSGPNPGESA
ncbi:cytochrome c oxidase assembly protein [Amycolatopsis sp. PS_44_ISF1]|uniref:cytochrome c oxidase assembly protein n=1 Tax=Amycolatopsis sp. PS_44_ISF1 TaxID=2974917 RepID=UPI0028DE7054|nr:cytochrome c oxidase assembly protein [Amycolatopsis sp. PS_44_ISF1]MDT8915243.1 cytochrome c oxidase assembly protein [Amycolatopsis sp. PS_44_ISF1]